MLEPKKPSLLLYIKKRLSITLMEVNNTLCLLIQGV